MRPNLTKNIHTESFKDFYWLKDELQSFCRENGISTSGSKLEISNRIEYFLQTGEIQNPIRKKSKAIKKMEPQVDLNLDTVITENHRCSQNLNLNPINSFRTFLLTRTIMEKVV